MPTETVYGLAGDATSDLAIRRIFEVKGRPATNPLIVHVPTKSDATRLAANWNDMAEKLADRFWPGALTIVVASNGLISPLATAGKSTVGLRIPAHDMALKLLRSSGLPLAAPSANKSNHISPTRAEHVRADFAESQVALVLDGGPCSVGIESTVISVAGAARAGQPRAKILRPGGISQREIEAVIGEVDVFTGSKDASIELDSPGQLAVHYAPKTPAFRFEHAQRQNLKLDNAAIVDLTLDPKTYARNLYARLRLLDTQGLAAIYLECPPDSPDWVAVRDRVMRATKPLPQQAKSDG